MSLWGHCPQREDPTYMMSVGPAATKLLENELWWPGPGWLKDEVRWSAPRRGEALQFSGKELEQKKLTVILPKTTAESESILNLDSFWSLTTLKHAATWVLRFIESMRNAGS